MAGRLVDVKLKILVVDQEAAALLEYREVRTVPLRQQVDVVAVRQLRLHLDHLTELGGTAHRMNVTEVT